MFLCYVCGAAGSGKTSLLRAFAGKAFLDSNSSSASSNPGSGDRRLGQGAGTGQGTGTGKAAYEPTKKMMSVVNSVDIEGEEKYLVLQEFGSQYEAEVLRDSMMTTGRAGTRGRMREMVDVMVYVHDSSDTNSFSYISNLRVSFLFSFFFLERERGRGRGRGKDADGCFSNNIVWIISRHCSWRQSRTSTLHSRYVPSLFPPSFQDSELTHSHDCLLIN